MTPIAFHFDFISPYAYLGWTQIHALAARHGREVLPVPTLFAALLAHGGTKGPAEIPLKRIYVMKDTTRIAHALGVPFGAPPTHPFNPLLALRVASIEASADERRRAIDALYRAVWGPSARGVEGEADVIAALDAAGLDGAAWARAASTPEIKQRLREQTDAAIADGVFGVPTMRVDGELFWGVDSLPHLERFLEGRDPITREMSEHLSRLRASATRKA